MDQNYLKYQKRNQLINRLRLKYKRLTLDQSQVEECLNWLFPPNTADSEWQISVADVLRLEKTRKFYNLEDSPCSLCSLYESETCIEDGLDEKFGYPYEKNCSKRELAKIQLIWDLEFRSFIDEQPSLTPKDMLHAYKTLEKEGFFKSQSGDKTRLRMLSYLDFLGVLED